MSEYIELAKKIDAHLQQLAPHVRERETATLLTEASKLLTASEALRANDKEQLAATQRVMEQMLEALNSASKQLCDLKKQNLLVGKALSLQPSTDALREHDARVLEEAANRFEDGGYYYTTEEDGYEKFDKIYAKALRRFAAELRATKKEG